MKKKILFSIDAGLFLSGIILALFSKLETSYVDARMTISSFLIISSYFLFPFLDMNKKEKIYNVFCVHLVIFLICFAALYHSLKFYIYNPNGGTVLNEILAAFGLLLVFSYIAYLFVGFVRTSYRMVIKIKTYLFSSSAKEGYSSTKKMIEGITAFLVALTEMAASVSALVASIKALIQ